MKISYGYLASRLRSFTTFFATPAAYVAAIRMHHDSGLLESSSTVTAVKNDGNGDAGAGEIPSVEHCAIHLRLLELIVDLRDRLKEWGAAGKDGDVEDDVWQIFVKLAVLRFARWFQTAAPSVIAMESSVPPLDMLMAWHSFILNPHAYHSFCEAARPHDQAGLRGISWSQLQRAMISTEHGDAFQLSSEDVEVAWSLGLHPDLVATLMESCFRPSKPGPGCSSSNRVDVLANRDNIRGEGDDAKTQALLGMYKELSSSPSSLPSSTDSIVYKHYDLADAVQRQATFALKMSRFGWRHCPQGNSILRHARERYRRFFTLISTLPAGQHVVPALDIDLVWHTHQLSPSEYREFSWAMTCQTNKRLVGHNDAITEEVASAGSKSTATCYRERFGDVYSICLSWYCQAARDKSDTCSDNNGKALLSPREIEKIRRAIAEAGGNNSSTVGRERRATNNKRRTNGRRLDLASCRCHEVAALPPNAGGALGGVAHGGCDKPEASCGVLGNAGDDTPEATRCGRCD